MAVDFQSFLNTYGKKDKKITQKDFKDYISKTGLSKEKAQAWADKINKGTSATKGIKLGDNVNLKDDVFKTKSVPKYSGTDIDLGRYEEIANIDFPREYIFQRDRLDNDIIINDLNNRTREYLKELDREIYRHSDLTQERWRNYMADQERAAAENVATIRGEYSLSLQNIVNAGMKDVETLRGEFALESDKVRGEYGLESERIRGETSRDVAKSQKEASMFGNLIQGFCL